MTTQISNPFNLRLTALRFRLLPATFAMAAMLSGCKSLLPQHASLHETPVPSAWSRSSTLPMGAGSVVSLAQWWQRFDDPALGALVMQALLANTDVRTAQAALQQSRALRDGKLANLGPTLKGSASAQRNQTDSNDATNSFQAGFDASWEPDVFGGQRSTLNAAQADAQAAEASLANVQVSLAAEVAVTYIELRGLQSRLAIARNSLATQSETLQITRWRAQAGLVSSLDVEQAVAASEQTSEIGRAHV